MPLRTTAGNILGYSPRLASLVDRPNLLLTRQTKISLIVIVTVMFLLTLSSSMVAAQVSCTSRICGDSDYACQHTKCPGDPGSIESNSLTNSTTNSSNAQTTSSGGSAE